MGWNDHIDNDLTVSLKELVSAGYVFEGGAPFEVAQKVISGGKNSLTSDDLIIFDEQVVSALRALDQAGLEGNIENALGPPSAED